MEIDVRRNVDAVRENIQTALLRSGRKEGDVKLIAVTKFMEEERILPAILAGIGAVGENRVQEMQRKLPFFEEHGLERHIIGQLQTNKVKYIVGKVALIQSLDRVELAAEIDKQAGKLGIVQDCLVEVNIGGEAQKGGVTISALPEFLQVMSAYPKLRVKGLMCIPPAVGAEAVRPYFIRMRELFTELGKLSLPNVSMEELSMGMSGDYKTAIEEGASMVRVGTAIFGPRA